MTSSHMDAQISAAHSEGCDCVALRNEISLRSQNFSTQCNQCNLSKLCETLQSVSNKKVFGDIFNHFQCENETFLSRGRPRLPRVFGGFSEPHHDLKGLFSSHGSEKRRGPLHNSAEIRRKCEGNGASRLEFKGPLVRSKFDIHGQSNAQATLAAIGEARAR